MSENTNRNFSDDAQDDIIEAANIIKPQNQGQGYTNTNNTNNTILFVPGLNGKSIEERKEVLSRLKRAAFTIFKKHNVVHLKAIGGAALLNAHSLSIKIRGSCASACGVDTCIIPLMEATRINDMDKMVRVLRIEAR